MLITELPDDILYAIFPYLTALEFLCFTSSSRTLLRVQDASAFWRPLTLRTFRIPPQPLLEGLQWQWLYKKLLTQTKLYTWGSNVNANLGRNTPFVNAAGRSIGHRSSGWPRQAELDDMNVGIIADVQCGGWCTTILDSLGNVFIFGVLNGVMRRRSLPGGRQLKFPPAYPPTTRTRYEPSTAIKQLSTGRSNILGLSDDGKVWSWTNDTAVMIKPLHVDLGGHMVKTVVAGWDRGTMYVRDIGIIYWAPIRDSDFMDGARQENLAVADALLIDTVTIPGTAFRRTARDRFSEDSLDVRIGEVTKFVVLETQIVFTTHLNRVFSYPTTYPMPAVDMPEPVELTTFTNTPSANPPLRILDLQGSFRSFAVFTSSNQILMADTELLNTFHDIQMSEEISQSPLPRPNLLETPFQRSRIISLAFGDHHVLALHEDGTLTSWGSEPQYCGALGLGDGATQKVRSLLDNRAGNAYLPRHHAKKIWFEPLMERWLSDVHRKAAEMGLLDVLGTFSDYYEDEGAKWEADITSKDSTFGAYFVLKVAAGGWSSAALVLVDEEKAERARQAHIVRPAAPPSDSSSAAEYEYGDSPFDMVEMVLTSIAAWVWGLGRWFLGLTERDARRASTDAVLGECASSDVNGVQYTWSSDPLPVEKIRALKGES